MSSVRVASSFLELRKRILGPLLPCSISSLKLPLCPPQRVHVDEEWQLHPNNVVLSGDVSQREPTFKSSLYIRPSTCIQSQTLFCCFITERYR